MGFPLLLNKAVTWGHEIWIWTFYKLHSFEERIVTLGNWAFSCPGKQSIGQSQEAWIARLYKVHFIRVWHVQNGQVGFPLLLNKTLKCGQET